MKIGGTAVLAFILQISPAESSNLVLPPVNAVSLAVTANLPFGLGDALSGTENPFTVSVVKCRFWDCMYVCVFMPWSLSVCLGIWNCNKEVHDRGMAHLFRFLAA